MQPARKASYATASTALHIQIYHIILALNGWITICYINIRYYLDLQLNVLQNAFTQHSASYPRPHHSTLARCVSTPDAGTEQKKHNCRIICNYNLQMLSVEWRFRRAQMNRNRSVAVWRAVVAHWSEMKLNRERNSKITTAQILNTYFGIFCCWPKFVAGDKATGRRARLTHSRIFYYN